MHQKWILAASSGLMLTGIIAGALTNVRGQAATPQAPATSPAIKPAEEAFKNIQVLKGIPSDQVFPSMQFIAASLGVDCEFCHVKDAFEKDDKPNKATARKMIAMQMAINKDNFKSRPQVTCYSCHRGSNDPVAIPIISDEPPKPAEVAAAAAEAGTAPKVTPDQVLEKFTQAVGGAEALQKVSSRVEKGTIAFGGHQFPVEIVAKAPDKRMAIVQAPNGENITAFNGSSGWLAGGGNPAHPMTPSEFEFGKMDADFYFAAHPKQTLGQLRPGRPEKIGGRTAIVLFARREGAPPVKLFFDEESGLLVRMVRYNETPLGRNPVQADFADYRDSGGVKIPFRWTVSRPIGRFTIEINEVQQNVAVDDARFAMPPAPKHPSQ